MIKQQQSIVLSPYIDISFQRITLYVELMSLGQAYK